MPIAQRIEAAPFLLIYLYRAPGEEFTAEHERLFTLLHEDLADGVALAEEAR